MLKLEAQAPLRERMLNAPPDSRSKTTTVPERQVER